MTKRTIRGLSWAAIALGGAGIGVYSVWTIAPESSALLQPARAALLWAAVALTVVGVGGVALAGLIESVMTRIMNWLEADFRGRPAKPGELERVREYAVKHFGESVSSLALMHQWRKRCKRTVWVIERVNRTGVRVSRDFVGYYIVLPLTAESCDQFEREELDGTSVPASVLTSSFGKAAAFYVAGIAADYRARPAAMAHLRGRIQTLRERHRVPVYTRPITKRGLKIVLDSGFAPIALSDNPIGRMFRFPPA